MDNEEESDYYYLKKDDDNCKKDLPNQSKISQICNNEEKEKIKRRWMKIWRKNKIMKKKKRK